MAHSTKTLSATLNSDALASIASGIQRLGISSSSSKDYDLIDSVSSLGDMVDTLQNLPTSPPSLYIDLEGDNLCRLGTISILQIHLHPDGKTYLVDISTLQSLAFSTPGITHTSSNLKKILEDAAVPKVFFDVRADSDALHALYGISLQGIEDLQLMELATSRNTSRRTVSGLARCISYDLKLSNLETSKFNATKELGKDLFCPERGGSYAVFDKRPLAKEIADYCVQDANILPRLWKAYNDKMTSTWRIRMLEMTKKRVRESQAPVFKGKGQHMALAPKEWLGLPRT